MRTFAFTLFALVAFAANSVLCRLALGPAAIDAASFSSVRLVSGALALTVITLAAKRGRFRLGGRWDSAAALFLYAVPFSFAYLSLSTGTGALVLFGSVQSTMMLSAILAGERPHPSQWLGLLIAIAGLVNLVLPGLTAPPLLGTTLMVIAGIAWGLYSLLGRRTADPLLDTASNFIRSVPLVLGVSLVAIPRFHLTGAGLLLAIVSGSMASALGYVAWYAALRGLTATRAAVVQLTVPVLAAAAGVVLLGEHVTVRLLVSGLLILGGVGLALRGREQLRHRRAHPAGDASATR
ncbi:MAG TPA: DMT family transporter [Opitutaceae bacterium]